MHSLNVVWAATIAGTLDVDCEGLLASVTDANNKSILSVRLAGDGEEVVGETWVASKRRWLNQAADQVCDPFCSQITLEETTH